MPVHDAYLTLIFLRSDVHSAIKEHLVTGENKRTTDASEDYSMNESKHNIEKTQQQIYARTIERIAEFNRKRSWDQFHNPKDLAISISLEAAELLECFQWSGKDLEIAEKRDHLVEETADVLIYALLMCQFLQVDPDVIINRKMDMNERKYPAD